MFSFLHSSAYKTCPSTFLLVSILFFLVLSDDGRLALFELIQDLMADSFGEYIPNSSTPTKSLIFSH